MCETLKFFEVFVGGLTELNSSRKLQMIRKPLIAINFNNHNDIIR